MSRELPADREKALAAVAGGWGREATTAHPLCTCTGKDGAITVSRRQSCPMHGTPRSTVQPGLTSRAAARTV